VHGLMVCYDRQRNHIVRLYVQFAIKYLREIAKKLPKMRFVFYEWLIRLIKTILYVHHLPISMANVMLHVSWRELYRCTTHHTSSISMYFVFSFHITVYIFILYAISDKKLIYSINTKCFLMLNFI